MFQMEETKVLFRDDVFQMSPWWIILLRIPFISLEIPHCERFPFYLTVMQEWSESDQRWMELFESCLTGHSVEFLCCSASAVMENERWISAHEIACENKEKMNKASLRVVVIWYCCSTVRDWINLKFWSWPSWMTLQTCGQWCIKIV